MSITFQNHRAVPVGASLPTSMGHTPQPRALHAIVLSFTKIAQEPRAVRQACALAGAGWRVTLAGYPSDNRLPDGCDFIPLEPVEPMPLPLRLFMTPALLACRFSKAAADFYYWLRPAHRAAAQRLAALDAALVVCNDHYTLPLGAQLARRNAARLLVDCHEYAVGQFPEDRFWNTFLRPYVDAIQKRYLPLADAVTVVSAGIARQLAADYNLDPPPTVVRNLPVFEPAVYRPCGETIEVLYHGLIAPTRELESLIEAFRMVRPEFRLVIRGQGHGYYIAALRDLCERLGLCERVRIEPPVAFEKLIEAASCSDVGIFLSSSRTAQMRYVLPNKLFEYIVAGLAVCVSDLDEMAAIVRAHGVGMLIADLAPATVADAINRLDRATIDACKQRSLAAARELNWEREQATFLRACGVHQGTCAA